ncbi:hypothetical protein ACVBEQ_01930 [Nakamurella sp. GG22]
MTTVLDVLRGRGYGDVDEAALVRAVEAALPARADGTLDDAAREFMREHAGVPVTDLAGAAQRMAARNIAAAAQTLPTAAVADLLGLHRTRIQHLREDGDLYAYRDGRTNRYPLWQFTSDGRPLPGLRQVLAELGDAHHSVITGLMTTEHAELDEGNGPISAREWLAGGRDPAPIVELARSVTAPW